MRALSDMPEVAVDSADSGRVGDADVIADLRHVGQVAFEVPDGIARGDLLNDEDVVLADDLPAIGVAGRECERLSILPVFLT